MVHGESGPSGSTPNLGNGSREPDASRRLNLHTRNPSTASTVDSTNSTDSDKLDRCGTSGTSHDDMEQRSGPSTQSTLYNPRHSHTHSTGEHTHTTSHLSPSSPVSHHSSATGEQNASSVSASIDLTHCCILTESVRQAGGDIAKVLDVIKRTNEPIDPRRCEPSLRHNVRKQVKDKKTGFCIGVLHQSAHDDPELFLAIAVQAFEGKLTSEQMRDLIVGKFELEPTKAKFIEIFDMLL